MQGGPTSAASPAQGQEGEASAASVPVEESEEMTEVPFGGANAVLEAVVMKYRERDKHQDRKRKIGHEKEKKRGKKRRIEAEESISDEEEGWFSVLPDETVLYIFGFLPATTLLYICNQVCHHWAALLCDSTLWRMLYKKRWGSEDGPMGYALQSLHYTSAVQLEERVMEYTLTKEYDKRHPLYWRQCYLLRNLYFGDWSIGHYSLTNIYSRSSLAFDYNKDTKLVTNVYADGIVSQQTWEGKQVLSARLHESHCPVHRAIIKGDEIFVGGNGVVNVFKIDENQELKRLETYLFAGGQVPVIDMCVTDSCVCVLNNSALPIICFNRKTHKSLSIKRSPEGMMGMTVLELSPEIVRQQLTYYLLPPQTPVACLLIGYRSKPPVILVYYINLTTMELIRPALKVPMPPKCGPKKMPSHRSLPCFPGKAWSCPTAALFAYKRGIYVDMRTLIPTPAPRSLGAIVGAVMTPLYTIVATAQGAIHFLTPKEGCLSRYFSLLDFQRSSSDKQLSIAICDGVDAKHSKILIRPENGDILLIDSQQHGRAQQRTHFAEYLTSPTTRLGIQQTYDCSIYLMEEYNTFIRSMANQSAPSSLAEIREDVLQICLAFSERLQNISAVGGQQHSTTAAVLVYQAHLEKIISWERWICSISRDAKSSNKILYSILCNLRDSYHRALHDVRGFEPTVSRLKVLYSWLMVKIAEAEEARLEFHRAELRNIEKWLADQDEAEKATIAAMETTCDEKQVVIPLDESMAAQPGYQPGAFERLLAPGAPGSLWSPIQIADARGHLYSIYEWDKIKEPWFVDNGVLQQVFADIKSQLVERQHNAEIYALIQRGKGIDQIIANSFTAELEKAQSELEEASRLELPPHAHFVLINTLDHIAAILKEKRNSTILEEIYELIAMSGDTSISPFQAQHVYSRATNLRSKFEKYLNENGFSELSASLTDIVIRVSSLYGLQSADAVLGDHHITTDEGMLILNELRSQLEAMKRSKREGKLSKEDEGSKLQEIESKLEPLRWNDGYMPLWQAIWELQKMKPGDGTAKGEDDDYESWMEEDDFRGDEEADYPSDADDDDDSEDLDMSDSKRASSNEKGKEIVVVPESNE